MWESVRSTLIDAIGQAFWLWLWGWVVISLAALRSWFTGQRGPWTYGLVGAASGLALALTAALLLKWWGPRTFYSAGGITAGASVLLVAFRRRRAHAEYVSGFEKGFFDHFNDGRRADAKAARALMAVTKETVYLGDLAKAGTKEIDVLLAKNRPLALGKVGDRTADKMFRAARRIDRHAIEYSKWNAVVIAARRGLLAVPSNDPTTKDRNRNELTSIRETTSVALGHTKSFADVIRKQPNMSQRMNMAKANLLTSMQKIVDEMQKTVQFCNDSLKKIK